MNGVFDMLQVSSKMICAWRLAHECVENMSSCTVCKNEKSLNIFSLLDDENNFLS